MSAPATRRLSTTLPIANATTRIARSILEIPSPPRLFEAGAVDVSLQNIQMKKNRPGFLVRALARPADRGSVARALFAHSTAIGVRTSEWDRLVLEREKRRVATPFGRIGVKLVRDLDGRVSASAEYDDCRAAAEKHEVAIAEVVRAAEDAARRELA